MSSCMIYPGAQQETSRDQIQDLARAVAALVQEPNNANLILDTARKVAGLRQTLNHLNQEMEKLKKQPFSFEGDMKYSIHEIERNDIMEALNSFAVLRLQKGWGWDVG